MKHLFLLLTIGFGFSASLAAQSFAINDDGSPANNSALLDVKSTTKGMLIPRMSKAERIAIAAPATGLLVYQNAPDSTGFYYYNGTVWKWFSNPDSETAWNLNGNGGTNPATNYIGTSDNTDLGFRINGFERMRIHKNGNVGIGTNNPLAKLHILDSNVVFSATGDVPGAPGPVPVSGAGRRMMWYADKAALRAGYVDAAYWDAANIGRYSAAFGKNTVASGIGATSFGNVTTASGGFSFCIGELTVASGNYSTAMGSGSISGGSYSTAMGFQTLASGFISTSMGGGSVASGAYSTCTGFSTRASGDISVSMGNNSVASGTNSTSMGGATTASGFASTSMGSGTAAKEFASTSTGYVTIARSPYSLTAGLYNDTTNTNRLFEIGNGTAHNARSNALTVLLNGNVGIGTTSPTKQTEIIGAASATPVTLVIGNRGGFGPAAMELVSDFGLGSQWRPGYIRSNDVGGFTGAVEVYTNGTGAGNLYGSVKGLEIRNGVTYTATGTVGSFSDERIKNNVQPFTSGLDIINQINPVSFYYNQQSPFKTDKMQIGVMAQELEKVAPYMVDKNVTKEFDDLRSVNNQAYIFLLINAVKELQAEIEVLKNKK